MKSLLSLSGAIALLTSPVMTSIAQQESNTTNINTISTINNNTKYHPDYNQIFKKYNLPKPSAMPKLDLNNPNHLLLYLSYLDLNNNFRNYELGFDSNNSYNKLAFVNNTAFFKQTDIINSDVNTFFVGDYTLVNNTNVDQTLKTPEYSKAINNSYSLTTNVNFGFETSFGIKGMGASFNASIGIETSQSKSIEDTLTAPSLDILVSAKSRVKVDYHVFQTTTTVIGNLEANVNMNKSQSIKLAYRNGSTIRYYYVTIAQLIHNAAKYSTNAKRWLESGESFFKWNSSNDKLELNVPTEYTSQGAKLYTTVTRIGG